MKLTPFRRFLYSAVPFSVLAAAFKVMTLVEGLTEVRPANAIPMIAGLLCGPMGALGCAAGNLIGDLFGSLSWASGLGMAGNFLAAFLPWRLWHLLSHEEPNVHTWKNLGIYTGLSLISALTVAWLLSFGLELFFGTWMREIYRYVLYNNAAFSLGLGLPLFIVLTSDSIGVEPCVPQRQPADDRSRRLLQIGTGIYALFMISVFAGVFLGYHPGNSRLMGILSILSLLLLALLCLTPGSKGEKQHAK